MVRLQKFLAAAGIASRREAEKLILGGAVKVNDRVVREMGVKINPQKDKVYYRGRPVKIASDKIYVAFNKPVGVISSCRRYKEKTVLDFIPLKERLYPVGRLDKNSSGLMLLTNDGELALKLTHPRYIQEKEYLVEVDRNLSAADLRKLGKGVIIEKHKTLPAEIKSISDKKFAVILREGKKRQIRKMCEAVGCRAVKLQRIRIKNIKLGNLPTGKWRYLKEEEINTLNK